MTECPRNWVDKDHSVPHIDEKSSITAYDVNDFAAGLKEGNTNLLVDSTDLKENTTDLKDNITNLKENNTDLKYVNTELNEKKVPDLKLNNNDLRSLCCEVSCVCEFIKAVCKQTFSIANVWGTRRNLDRYVHYNIRDLVLYSSQLDSL